MYADEIGLVPAVTMQRRESNAAAMLASTITQLGSTVTTTVTSTVTSPFHNPTAEAEKAKRLAGRRRSVYGGSVRGHSTPVPGAASTYNPLQQALRQQMLNNLTKATVPQQMEDRSEHSHAGAAAGAESSTSEVQEGGAPSTAAPSISSGYVKLVSDSHADEKADTHIAAPSGGISIGSDEHSGSAFTLRSAVNRSSSGDNFKFTAVPSVAPTVAADDEEGENEEEEEDGDDTPVGEK